MSYTDYYRARLHESKVRVEQIPEIFTNIKCSTESKDKSDSLSITGKKRNYKEAMGFQNDYEVVQEPELTNIQNGNSQWIDAYSENLFNK